MRSTIGSSSTSAGPSCYAVLALVGARGGPRAESGEPPARRLPDRVVRLRPAGPRARRPGDPRGRRRDRRPGRRPGRQRGGGPDADPGPGRRLPGRAARRPRRGGHRPEPVPGRRRRHRGRPGDRRPADSRQLLRRAGAAASPAPTPPASRSPSGPGPSTVRTSGWSPTSACSTPCCSATRTCCTCRTACCWPVPPAGAVPSGWSSLEPAIGDPRPRTDPGVTQEDR